GDIGSPVVHDDALIAVILRDAKARVAVHRRKVFKKILVGEGYVYKSRSYSLYAFYPCVALKPCCDLPGDRKRRLFVKLCGGKGAVALELAQIKPVRHYDGAQRIVVAAACKRL